MRWTHIAGILMIAISLTQIAGAIYWSSSVNTNSSHWSIYRQSSNISFDLSSSVEGEISPVESRGRILRPYQSYYQEVGSNDVRLRQRTSALEGSYKSTDELKLQSTVYPDQIEILVDKPAGTKIFTIEYKNEIWPVSLRTSRTLEYSGQGINDRDFQGNNGDFVGANFLYNQKLSKEQRSVIWLQRTNATVIATNDSILSAELKSTKYLGYQIEAATTGISDLSYKQRDYNYDVSHQNYPAMSEGEERYYGTYNLSRKIEMRSLFEDIEEADYGWLPCCSGVWDDLEHSNQTNIGLSAYEIFDCTCNRGSDSS